MFAINVWINGIVAQPCEPGINRNIEIRIDGESLEPSIPDGIDVVFHEAAYGGYMPEISKYVAVNIFGTAQLLEIIREKNLGIRKIIVASSQVVYPEGAGECPPTWPGLSWVETGPAASARRLFGPLPGVSESDKIGADTGGCAARRRNSLRNHKGGSGKTRAHLGKASWDSHRCLTILLHFRPAPIYI